MIIETTNGMHLYKGYDAITGKRISLNSYPIYIEIGDGTYDRFWVNKDTFYLMIEFYQLFTCNPTEIYLSFEDVQVIKRLSGVKEDKKVSDEEVFEEPFREYYDAEPTCSA